MLADELDFVIGVDPHRDAHAIAVVEVCAGVVVVESSVAADSGGYREALRVAEEHAPGLRAFAIEGAGSFRAGLRRLLPARGGQGFGGGESAARAARPMRSTRSGPLGLCSSRSGPRGRAAAESARRCGP